MNSKAIELKNVNIKFNLNPVLKDINLTIEENDFMAIIGPNGGGKSTLLKIILGILKPDSGEVLIFGKKPEDARQLMGYLPQKVSFDHDFPIDVFHTVLSGRYRGLFKGHTKDDEIAVIKALKDMNMFDLKDRQISRLSGGQIQRVFIARAIVREPKILLMDEPMASIDPEMQNSFYSLLSRLKNKMTIILVSHDVGTVSTQVDKIACLNSTLYFHGPVEDAAEGLEELYKCPIEMITHGFPHRVLKDH
ncbi:metal ABC transporter ATP-binding protein [Methanobacterium spitsbergense]|uniref:Metal ABC transporter ATP-binding protein n=1 Tax=Methanobacterium spitsbergense TaxID=2874285 RepID=A0A8T5V1R7_9EURY|nr:metal ABC transporter ATP-binding protein [Methanobacterium spitsbergense]MBZ2166899.1 metal ABC transporter ATP-binding protein [Methanobacterium spitsbergense]